MLNHESYEQAAQYYNSIQNNETMNEVLNEVLNEVVKQVLKQEGSTNKSAYKRIVPIDE